MESKLVGAPILSVTLIPLLTLQGSPPPTVTKQGR